MKQENSGVGFVKLETVTFAHPPNELLLESGEKLGPITLAYETYGELNKTADNAILITHALSGDSHAAGYYDENERKLGWWDFMIGPGRPFDTDKYFIISSNVIGGCKGSTGPQSINPSTDKPYELNFPVITITDMVKAQKLLVEYLGIEKLLCVAGGSMGGMQVLEWVVRYPDKVVAAMPIAKSPLPRIMAS